MTSSQLSDGLPPMLALAYRFHVEFDFSKIGIAVKNIYAEAWALKHL